jgi:hypothetical protein
MKRPIFVILSIVSIVICLAIVQVGVSNQIATTGAGLVALQKELTQYKQENILLQEQVLKASALTTIEEEAEKRGFVAVKNPVHLSTPLPLALKQ